MSHVFPLIVLSWQSFPCVVWSFYVFSLIVLSCQIFPCVVWSCHVFSLTVLSWCLNPFSPTPDSESAQKLASSTGFRSRNTMHTNERGEVTTTHFLQLFPCSTIRTRFAEFLHMLQFLQHHHQHYTLRGV